MAGKRTGSAVYIHRSAVSTLTDKTLQRVWRLHSCLPKTWKYNFLIIELHAVSFVSVPTFDKVFEPVLGDRYRVLNSGQVIFKKVPKHQERVLHQRYKTVKSDYEGFDIEQDKAWERGYRKYFTAKQMSGFGFRHKWEEAIKDIVCQLT